MAERPVDSQAWGMQLHVLSRFLQLELSEMEAFVNQHKSKAIKRQVMPLVFISPLKIWIIFFLNHLTSEVNSTTRPDWFHFAVSLPILPHRYGHKAAGPSAFPAK